MHVFVWILGIVTLLSWIAVIVEFTFFDHKWD